MVKVFSYKLCKKTSVYFFEGVPCFCSFSEVLGTLLCVCNIRAFWLCAILLAFWLLWMKPPVFQFVGLGWGVVVVVGERGRGLNITLPQILQVSKAEPGLLLTFLHVGCSHPASSAELGQLCTFLVWGWAVTTTVLGWTQPDQCFFWALKHFLFLQKQQSF